STWTRWPPPGAGCPPCSGARPAAGSPVPLPPGTMADMERRPPAPASATMTDIDDPQRIAAALEAACDGLGLPEGLRELLQRARDALRATCSDAEGAQLRYRALFDAVPDPVSILDERGIVLDLNKAG